MIISRMDKYKPSYSYYTRPEANPAWKEIKIPDMVYPKPLKLETENEVWEVISNCPFQEGDYLVAHSLTHPGDEEFSGNQYRVADFEVWPDKIRYTQNGVPLFMKLVKYNGEAIWTHPNYYRPLRAPVGNLWNSK